MNITTIEKLIRQIRDATPGADDAPLLASQLHGAIIAEGALLRRMRRYYAARECVEGPDGSIAHLRAELVSLLTGIQNDCPHDETTYHGDAAGGSDSFTRCDLCQKVL